MRKMNKFLSAIMAFCMLLGTLSMLSGILVFAEEKSEVKKPTNAIGFLSTVFSSKEEKVESMTFKLERYGYKLYVEPITGEVAVVNSKTGDILTTNPYDVGAVSVAEDTGVKQKLLSQIMIDYNSIDGTISGKELNSFEDAAQMGQIKVKNIKNGVRIEYVIGKQEVRYNFPDMIEKSRFEEEILAQFPIDPETYDSKTATAEEKQIMADYNKFKGFYTLKDTEKASASILNGYYRDYPILDPEFCAKEGLTPLKAIYVFDVNAAERQKNIIEELLLKYCPNYTFEDREKDHEMCNYTPADSNPVQFRVALEYYLDEDGLRVRMPANGIRYDQNSFMLNKITCLPYMGAGNASNVGYTMFPDGSGTLTRFEDVKESGKNFNFFATPYGQDYAYHSLKSDKNLMPMRMPVFGLAEEIKSTLEDGTEVTRSQGYFAIIEEGDTLAMVRAMHGDKSHPYNSIQIELDPRPKDTYTLNVVSATGNNSFTKVSDRKYTGSFVIRYMMLTDVDYLAEKGVDTNGMFDATYIGMALAYRYRLLKTGALTDRIDSSEKDIPLYAEVLGAMDVQEKFLSIPVTVTKALTTFEDVKTMHKELGEGGVNNVIFKLTGFINGGLKDTLSNRIKTEKAVGGNNGLKNLQKYANEKGFEIFLDADFTYAKKDTWFDGFNRRAQAVRTVDDRFVMKKTYSPMLQDFTSTGMMVISPSAFEDILDDLNKDAKKLGLKGLSLGGLGSDISSDFDESDPYNREDSKGQIVETLKKVRELGYSVMIDGGNSYAVGYADHILSVPLDSSRRSQASEAVPFFGLVYHGYLSYAGSPTNMAGDIRYETLKMLENGANPYFVLVYRNSDKLKEDPDLCKYFSISYQNWKEDLTETYGSLNKALSPVINSPFANHEFLTGMRIPTAEELAEDAVTGADESKYFLDNGQIVKVTFENGYSFILNYNIYNIKVEELGDTVIGELGYVVLDSDGKIVLNSAEEVAA